jgi:hypothetical protein
VLEKPKKEYGMTQTYTVTSADDPQTQDYTVVPNVFLSPRAFKFPANTFKVLLYFVRNTYGYHHSEYSVGIAQICRDLDISHQTASVAIQNLLKKSWLDITREGNRQSGITREYRLASGILTVTW